MQAALRSPAMPAVGVDDVQEPWMLGRAVIVGRTQGPRVATADKPESENLMGDIKKNDRIIDVIKLEPISPRSRCHN